MSSWTGQGGPGGSSGSEFIHVDHDGHAGSSPGSGTTGMRPDFGLSRSIPTKSLDRSSNTREREQRTRTSSSQRGRSSNGSTSSSSSSIKWQSTINQLTDQTIPEDQAAIRRLGEDVRKAGAAGAQAAVGALRTRMADKNATPESRVRSISVARVLAQKAISGVDAQRQIADPSFVNTLKSIASDPNVRASLKTWASQIRIGDPAEASELASITGLDEHLSEGVASQTPRRPPANIPGTASFQGRPQLATTEEVDEPRSAITAHNSGSQLFGAPMPGGFGLDGGAFDANGSVAGGSNGSVREFPQSTIQGIPPHLLIPQLETGGGGGAQPLSHPAPPSGWGEDEDGVQSDAPSTRSKRTTKTKSRLGRSTLGVATPSIDGGREARSRLDQQIPRHEHSSSTLASSFGADGTMSEVESTHTPGGDSLMYARHHGTGIPVPPITVPAATPVPTVAPQVLPPSRQRSISPDPIRVPRRRSPSPRGARSRMASRARAESRRRPAPAADPAAMLIELTGVQFVRARKDYDALRDDELSLNEGDILAVIKREADGRYWLGHIQGQVGRFPVHVVDVLSHQSRTQGDSTAQEEKTTELLRRAREIEDFMEHLHEFDITRHCITDDDDIQADLSSLLELRREVVRHLDETTTGIGRLKAMLNQIKQAQRVHDRLIDSRIAGYAARTAIHDETPRMNYQDLPSNMGYPYAAPPFDMTPYARRTSGMPPQQIEQAPRPSITQRGYNDQRGYNEPAAALRYRQSQEMGYPPRTGHQGIMPPRARTYSYAPASTPTTQQSPDDMSMYATEPNTPGEPLIAGATNGQFPLPMSAQTGGWGESERGGTVKDDVGRTTRSGRNRGPSDTSAHTHTSRRGAF
ncbi:SH3 domain protein [Rhizoctonia solani]|uniref:SH3 domain protein n=1 Tax=Rhizoctonia solani TaxID=456999 RepID=A0A8H8PB35_9AGAM|nr:SH3 domain protein [Rhizoctonia solani]QRW27502.1 SH3 domain protein [Rhizoctonia solani]